MESVRHVGKYELLERLGRGHFATVYRARDVTLGRMVALKILHAHIIDDPTFLQRFKHEARAAALLDHPHIITIYEIGEIAGQHYIAMQYLSGRGLDELLAESDGPLPLLQVADIVAQVAEALDYVHRRDAVHRDVKPSNIIVSDAGHVTLLDFGIVRVADGIHLTATGDVVGTPHYMSPEQVEGQTLDHRADLYALGVVAYQLCTGKAPFDGVSPLVVLRLHADKDPPAPRELNPELPEMVEELLLKMLAKCPDERYQSAGEFAQALQAALTVVEQEGEREEERAAEEPVDLSAQPISGLNLSTRAANVLLQAGIGTFGDVMALLEEGDEALLNLPGFGPKSLTDLKRKLRARGFTLPVAEGGQARSVPQKTESIASEKMRAHERREDEEVFLHRLNPWNPLDQFRLLWWALVVPGQLRAHRRAFGAESGKHVGGWLTSTLIWSPVLLFMLGLALGTMPSPGDVASYYSFLIFVIALWAWTFLTSLGDEFWMVFFAIGLVLAGFMGFLVITEDIVAEGAVNMVVVGGAFAVTTITALVMARVVAEGVVFLVAGGTACGALGLMIHALGGGRPAIGMIEVIVLGVLLAVIVFVTSAVMRDVKSSVETARPSWLARGTFGLLVLTYAFLIWFSFLGGWGMFL